jgi:hypothetical protein
MRPILVAAPDLPSRDERHVLDVLGTTDAILPGR